MGDTSMRWFGRPWGAEFCRPETEVFLPADTFCMGCLGEIEPGASGVRMGHVGGGRNVSWFHLDCFLETIGVAPISRTSDASRESR